jgi:hypothetical protein
MIDMLLALCCLLPGKAGADSSFPQVAISNGIVYARIYLPDTAKGYYRGARFDWSGVMPELTYKGHSYTGQWFERYAPTINDAVMGPVESFDQLGYEEAGPGGSFLAIGIGILARPDAAPYTPFRYYRIVNPGKWTVKSSAAKVEFEQKLNDTGYAYTYHKTVELEKGRPELVIRHSLKNTGKRRIETNVYDHNLWLLDQQPVGPGLALRMPFALSVTEARRVGPVNTGDGRSQDGQSLDGQGRNVVAAIRDSQIVFLQKLARREDCYAVLHGYGDSAKDYAINIENRHTGAGIRIEGDRPLSRLVFWSSSTIACPEPYIHVRIDPGEVFTWTIRYEFYTISVTSGGNKTASADQTESETMKGGIAK